MNQPAKALFLVLSVLLASATAGAQVTDANGYITTRNWLALGPFAQPDTCGGSPGQMLANYIAPSEIQCLWPADGEEIEYDPALSRSTQYTGPLPGGGGPRWRIFNDGSPDCDVDLSADTAASGRENVVTFLATYVEYMGPAAIDVDVCVASDDGVQVWVDDRVAVNVASCRGRAGCAAAVCDDVGRVTLEPGPHRIAVGVWNGCCGWGFSLRLQVEGVPVVEGDPDWVFHGVVPPDAAPPCASLPLRAVSGLGIADSCPPTAGGPVKVTITQAGGNPGDVLDIRETIRGAIRPAAVVPEEGGTVTALPELGPLAPVGIFQDHRNVVTAPVCAAGNGETTESVGVYTLTNAGADIWTDGDTCQFAYSNVRGDFDVSARILTRTAAPASRWGKHGLMARQDLTPRSRYSYTQDAVGDVPALAENNDDSIRHASRPTHGGADNFEATPFATNPDPDGTGVVDDDYCDGQGPDDGPGCLVGCPDTRDAGCVVHDDHLRLVRTGNLFTSYSRPSPDAPWTFLGSCDWGPTAPQDVLVGLTATSHVSDCFGLLEVQFDQVDFGGATVVPLPGTTPQGVEIAWSVPRSVLQGGGLGYTIDFDEGRLEFDGSASGTPIGGDGNAVVVPVARDFGPFTNPDFEHAHAIGRACSGMSVYQPLPGSLGIEGAGNDIWADGDQFVFAYTSVAGDFSASVRIAEREFAPGSRWGKHGIMARQDCTVRSRYTFLHDQGEDPQDTVRLAARPTHGGADNYEITPAVGGVHVDEMRMDRIGDVFITYALDSTGALGGVPGELVEIARHDWGPTAPESVLVGLAVTSHQGCDVTAITFSDWDLSLGTPAVGVQDLTCASNASGGVDIAWANPAGANPAVPISIRIGAAEVATVPGTATSATIPAGQLPADPIFQVDVLNSSGFAATCVLPEGLSLAGFINRWLFLSPLAQPGGANPPVATIRLDYLADGAGATETNVQPRDGDTIATDFGGAAASTGVVATPLRPDLNPGGVPRWHLHVDPDDTINFDDYHGSNVDDFVTYGVVYLDVPADVVTNIGLASDDSIQVLLDGQEVWVNSAARGYDVANAVTDVVSSAAVASLNPLRAGSHTLMVKVFDGTLGNGFRLRFQDGAGNPLVVGAIRHEPGGAVGPEFHRGDGNDDGAVNITDGIYILNYLFLGGATPTCIEAANANDDDAVNITDGIFVLNYLFLGGPTPPAPGPAASPCG
ncbi:MAG: hypothetical protein OIN84_12320, partial [Candidatus Methanoperedens sp.]|nr:hypothetical protein [Candidatus Methanoperedens sp.]